jgi:hypothetical protein
VVDQCRQKHFKNREIFKAAALATPWMLSRLGRLAGVVAFLAWLQSTWKKWVKSRIMVLKILRKLGSKQKIYVKASGTI